MNNNNKFEPGEILRYKKDAYLEGDIVKVIGLHKNKKGEISTEMIDMIFLTSNHNYRLSNPPNIAHEYTRLLERFDLPKCPEYLQTK